jgi:hypothetical protein
MPEQPAPSFDAFFHSTTPRRDKFLSVVFSQFSERLVRAWCAEPASPYEDLGRPTLWDQTLSTRQTIDFTLKSRSTGRVYVSELKCELEFESYRYLTLTGSHQLLHHNKEAFQRFLALARDPQSFVVRVNAKATPVDGAILVWGAVSAAGRLQVMRDHGFADVLSVESMLADLNKWRPSAWLGLVRDYRSWTLELFDLLDGGAAPLVR